MTDEAFRAMFMRDPAATLTRFTECGYELTPLEIAAIKATDPGLWTRTAEQIDPRLQKVFDAVFQGVFSPMPEEEP